MACRLIISWLSGKEIIWAYQVDPCDHKGPLSMGDGGRRVNIRFNVRKTWPAIAVSEEEKKATSHGIYAPSMCWKRRENELSPRAFRRTAALTHCFSPSETRVRLPRGTSITSKNGTDVYGSRCCKGGTAQDAESQCQGELTQCRVHWRPAISQLSYLHSVPRANEHLYVKMSP